jgi:hypothetical protein
MRPSYDHDNALRHRPAKILDGNSNTPSIITVDAVTYPVDSNIWAELNPLGEFGDLIRPAHRVGGFASISHGFAGKFDLPVKTGGAEGGNKGADHRPRRSPASSVCGLPLGAKIILSLILVWPAWRCVDVGLDYLDGFGDRDRDRRRTALWLCIALLLFGLIFMAWLWTGS